MEKLSTGVLEDLTSFLNMGMERVDRMEKSGNIVHKRKEITQKTKQGWDIGRGKMGKQVVKDLFLYLN